MSLLFRIVYAAHARGTHHKLALDALRHLTGPNVEVWQRLFLKHADIYLEGAKAPDTQFKDFKNHVLHVGNPYWGGAPEKAESWYLRLVETLAAESWSDAVYCAGILSHYYSDPIHPFHTGQTEAENNIHRAAEWSISKSYDTLKAIGEGLAPIAEHQPGTDARWLRGMVIQGAEVSHQHYEKLIAHYDINKGVVDPPAGLDDVSRRMVGALIVYAYRGFALVLDRAFREAAITPPEVALTLDTVMAAIKIPAKTLLKRLADRQDRQQVERMYDELKATGRVEVNLPEDDRMVRDLYRAEVLIPREAELAHSRATRLQAMARTTTVLERAQVAIPPVAAAGALTQEMGVAIARRVERQISDRQTTARMSAVHTTTRVSSESVESTLSQRLAGLSSSAASLREPPGSRPAINLETVVLAPRRSTPSAPRVDSRASHSSVVTTETSVQRNRASEVSEQATSEGGAVAVGGSLVELGRSLIGTRGAASGSASSEMLTSTRESIERTHIVDEHMRAQSSTTLEEDAVSDADIETRRTVQSLSRPTIRLDGSSGSKDDGTDVRFSTYGGREAERPASSMVTRASVGERVTVTSDDDQSTRDTSAPAGDGRGTSIRRMARLDDTLAIARAPSHDTDEMSDGDIVEEASDLLTDDGGDESDEASRDRQRRSTTDGERASRRRTRTSVERDTGPRFYLSSSDDVVAAPSIGPKMAERLKALGIHTVADLLAADPETVSVCLSVRGVKTETVRDWQDQARLVCDVPGLRGTHAQLLVGSGLRDLFAVANADPATLLVSILRFAQTRDGERVLRSGEPPDIEKITTWIGNAVRAREARAA